MYFEFIFIEGVRLRLRLICWRVNGGTGVILPELREGPLGCGSHTNVGLGTGAREGLWSRREGLWSRRDGCAGWG